MRSAGDGFLIERGTPPMDATFSVVNPDEFETL